MRSRNFCYSIVWLFVLICIAWPLAFFVGGVWIVLQVRVIAGRAFVYDGATAIAITQIPSSLPSRSRSNI
jgi:hypothetical protein